MIPLWLKIMLIVTIVITCGAIPLAMWPTFKRSTEEQAKFWREMGGRDE